MARRRYQRGSLIIRGKRQKAYVLRYYEEVLLPDNSLGRTRRSKVIGLVSEIGSKREARKLADAILLEQNPDTNRPQSAITFGQFVKQWEEKILPLKKPSTQEFYRDIIGKHLLPCFSVKRLCDLGPSDVQGFITAQAQRFAWQTVHHMKVALNQVLNQALEWGYLRENPANRVRMPRRPPRLEQVILTPAQLRELLQELAEPYKTLVATATVTGMRRCELFAVRWCDVDLEARIIHVRQRIYRGRIDTPKSPRSIRDLPIPKWLAAALQQHRLRSKGTDSGFVFARPDGKPMSPTSVASHVLRPALKQLGLPEVSWHCFRRTLATWLSAHGTQIKTAQEQLGHASATTTMEFYIQSLPGSRRQAIEQFGRVLDPNGPKMAVSQTKQTPEFVGNVRETVVAVPGIEPGFPD